MTRENRANVLFLTLFLGISLPGAVILFKKKLDPAAPAMSMPDPVKRRLPYMFPHPVSTEVSRFVPKLAGEWVSKVNTERGGEPNVLSTRDRLPLLSADRRFQITDLRRVAGAGGATESLVHVVTWDESLPADPARYTVTVQAGQEQVPAAKVEADSYALPPNVRKELIYSGYSKPPTRVTWLTLRFPGDLSARESLTVSITHANASGGSEQASVQIDSNPTS